MYIKTLEIKGFGKLKDLALDFTKGFNVVFGNNEAGKTSVQLFIKGMFYGLKGGRTARDGVLPPLKKYKPWRTEDYSGVIEYSLDSGEAYRAVRNFSNNSIKVYDSLFNDITNRFDLSREKGVQFAEKHIGLGEACFEKTVFVRQMDSRIDADGSSELLSRLANVSQTGFEDVSFKKAEAALKEALKNHVGTDKTSTRPYDRIAARLDELRSAKFLLQEKRNSMLSYENEYKDTADTIEELEGQKLILSVGKELLSARRQTEKDTELEAQLREILDNAKAYEGELRLVHDKIEDCRSMVEKFQNFAGHGSEDIDELNAEYLKFCNLQIKKDKLEQEIKLEEDNKAKIKLQLEHLKEFDNFGESTEYDIAGLNRDLERLKNEYSKVNVESLDEKVKASRYKEKLLKYNTVICTAVLAALLALGLTVLTPTLALSPVAFAIMLALIFVYIKSSKATSKLLGQKRAAVALANELGKEIEKRKKSLDDIFERTGTRDMEGFFRLKAEYDSKAQSLHSMDKNLEKLLMDYSSTCQDAAVIKSKINGKLLASGLISNPQDEINEVRIKDFANGARGYCSQEPNLDYLNRSHQDLSNRLKELYNRSTSLWEKPLDSIEGISYAADEMGRRIAEGRKHLDMCVEKLKQICTDHAAIDMNFEEFRANILDTSLSSAEGYIESALSKVMEKLNSAALKAIELETLLKSNSGDGDDIQRMDEEIAELEAKKLQLEDLNASIKSAIEIMAEASTEIQRDFAPVLNSRMSEIMGKISGGRYKDLRADDRLYLKAIAPETRDVVPAAALSGGTVDQIYLALRFAMADLIGLEDEKLPIIMDEVFAQYDDIRTDETISLLKQLSSGRQIILFTCKQREVDIARAACGENLNVIELK